MAMGKADTQAAMGNDFGEREIGRVDIEVALDQLEVWGDLAEEFEGVAVREVAETEDLADFTGSEEFFELY